jgi:hypothetical protein
MGMGSRVQRIVIGIADQNGLREQCADAAQAIMFVPEEGRAVPESFIGSFVAPGVTGGAGFFQ